MRRVAINVPSGGDWKVGFGASLVDMVLHIGANPIPGEDVALGLNTSEGSLLPGERQRLVHAALARDATHILWLDDDMTFPPDTLHRLLSHGQPIVAANCTTRRLPTWPVAVKGGKRVASKGRTGLEEVDHVGLAVMLTDIRVFKAIPEPWFMFGFQSTRKEYVGEDVFFCRLAREKGFKVLIDHDLSQEIGHLGSHEFHHAMTESTE